ncbi:MAG: rex [Oscillospiraceae bacterium]|jgi:redox-sensing transcriptional repressor|nr:rex [Oscillospiraceae bacterium]
MTKPTAVSLSVVRRLPRYYRFLGELLKGGCNRISSKELSEKMGLTASQIRQDLNCFGGFGQQGYGYNVQALYDEIAKILGLDKQQKTILIGAGNLGRAIVTHLDFSHLGFDLVGIFDNSDELVGETVGSLTVSHVDSLSEFCHENSPVIAILCIPKNAAEALADSLIELGFKGFWNFSHYDLAIDYHGIVVENVHLGDSLMTLCYRVKNNPSNNS